MLYVRATGGHTMSWRNVAVAIGLLAASSASGVVAEEHFKLKTGGDLLALCSVSQDDQLKTAAIHMCHGFCAGVYQTIVAFTVHDKVPPVICPPNPPPTRTEAIDRFVIWAKAKPEHHGERPADFVGRFLIETYPCPKVVDSSGGLK
jgi:hypothetical protein